MSNRKIKDYSRLRQGDFSLKHFILYLAICSLLVSSGLALVVLFAVMALGGSWEEPNIIIALVELGASIGIIALGMIGWLSLVRRGDKHF